MASGALHHTNLLREHQCCVRCGGLEPRERVPVLVDGVSRTSDTDGEVQSRAHLVLAGLPRVRGFAEWPVLDLDVELYGARADAEDLSARGGDGARLEEHEGGHRERRRRVHELSAEGHGLGSDARHCRVDWGRKCEVRARKRLQAEKQDAGQGASKRDRRKVSKAQMSTSLSRGNKYPADLCLFAAAPVFAMMFPAASTS